ncbi:MAG TPA: hypothetical protein VN723_00370 [Rhizomicrobium sp.]|nr:hypothetical protein [Rhizomicrobium sp.]
MTIRFHTALALGLGVLLASPASAKVTHPAHHTTRHTVHRGADVRYAQSFYDYRSASEVREEFRDSYRMRHDGHYGRSEFYRGRDDAMVLENLRTNDFTGGVGYGANGDVPYFVDGFGQSHFFVGNFRRMAPMGRFGAPRFGGGFHRGFR